MEQQKKCFFCNTSDQLILDNAHVIPMAISERIIDPPEFVDTTVVMCATCHRKYDKHLIFKYWVKLFKHYYRYSVTKKSIHKDINVPVENNKQLAQIAHRDSIIGLLLDAKAKDDKITITMSVAARDYFINNFTKVWNIVSTY